MNPTKKTAHLAGLIYLTVVVAGIFSLLYVPSQLIVWGNASTTFATIVANETLFRLGILAGAVCYIAFLFLPIVLYNILIHYATFLETQLIERLSMTAEERYRKLLIQQSEKIKLISLSLIASYLGITLERLSRIRKKMKV